MQGDVVANAEKIRTLRANGLLTHLNPVENGNVMAITCIDPRYDDIVKSALKPLPKNGIYIPPINLVGGAFRDAEDDEYGSIFFRAMQRTLTELVELFHTSLTVFRVIHGPDCKFCMHKNISLIEALRRQASAKEQSEQVFSGNTIVFRTAYLFDERQFGGQAHLAEIDAASAADFLDSYAAHHSRAVAEVG